MDHRGRRAHYECFFAAQQSARRKKALPARALYSRDCGFCGQAAQVEEVQ